VGVEGESQRRIRKLAPQRFVPVIRRTNHPLVGAIAGPGIAFVRSPCGSNGPGMTATENEH
jgi:hypothetical protein